jgi:hypothetical protein
MSVYAASRANIRPEMTRDRTEIQADIDTLEEFADAYRFYWGAPDERGDVPTEFVGNRATLRKKIHRMLGPAERIMQQAGTNGIGVIPHPAFRGPGRHGLAATAFAEEHHGFQGLEPPAYMGVLDAVDLTIGILEDELKEAGVKGDTPEADTEPPPISSLAQPAQHRTTGRHFPRLILGRVLTHVPKWLSVIERAVLFLAAVAGIVGVLGLIFGWWSN